MAKNRRIGILTGGGDVPGLNSVIKSLVYRARSHSDIDVIGFRRGWEGLTHCRPVRGVDRNYLLPLNRQNTRTVDRTGGTFLHTSRTNPSRLVLADLPAHLHKRAERLQEVRKGVVDATPIVLRNLEKLNIQNLVAIGGDDTLSYASRLAQEGVQIVAVPKTMDNDVQDTEYCIGFSTAMTRALNAITRLRTTLGSHERVGIVRMFGRDSGFTALYTAYVTSLRCCIPEVRFDLDRLIHMLMDDKKNNPSDYALLLISEGASWKGRRVRRVGEADAYGHRRTQNVAEVLAEHVKKAGAETTVMDLTYDLRSGEPDFLDKMVAFTFANMAFQCILDGASGRMMSIRNGRYTDTDIPDPKRGSRKVDVDSMYDAKRFRPNYGTKGGTPIFMMQA